MTIFYLNDTAKNQIVYEDSLAYPGTILEPGEGMKFNIRVKDDQMLRIKVWETGIVLLSGMDL